MLVHVLIDSRTFSRIVKFDTFISGFSDMVREKKLEFSLKIGYTKK